MEINKILSIRIDEKLYTKCIQNKLDNKTIVTKALNQYFRSKEPNKKLDQEQYTEPYTNVYNQDLLTIMQQQYQNHILDLQKQKEYLQNRLDYFITLKTPIINRLFQKQITEQATQKKDSKKPSVD